MKPSNPSIPDPAGQPGTPQDTPPVAGRIEPTMWAPPLEPSLPPALQSAPDVKSLLQALKRRWVTAACLGITLGGIAAAAAWYLLSPQYNAEAKIQVRYNIDRIMERSGGLGNQTDFVTYLRTQAAKILSSPVINEALKQDDLKRLNLYAREKDPATWILEHLKIDVQEKSEIVTLSLASSDPDLSVKVVKAVTDAYMQRCVYAEEQLRNERYARVESAYEEQNKELQRLKKDLEDYRESHKILGPGVAATRMAELQNLLSIDTTQQTSIRLQISTEMGKLNALDAQIRKLKDPTLASPNLELALSTDPIYKELENNVNRMQTVVDDFEAKTSYLGPTGEKAITLLNTYRQRLYTRRKQIAEKIANMATAGPGDNGRESLHTNREQIANTVKSLEELSKHLSKEMEGLSVQLAKLKVEVPEQDTMAKKIENQQKIVDELHKARTAEQVDLRSEPRITVFQSSELQKKDIKKQLMGVIGAPLGTLLAVCAFLAFSEYRQRRIRSASEVSRGLGIRVVGAVPEVPHLERHLVGPGSEPDLEGHPVLESFDAIRTFLLRNGQANRIVMVTSAAAGEGKTTLASHLAGSLARAGRRTLFIDGDLRSPAAHQLFELPMQPGFSEVILAEVELADAIQTTALDGLSFIAAGQWDREVLYALARDGLEGIFEKLLQEFDFIVIDSHPVLAATDSLLIGQQVDSVLMSVRREVSQMPRVYTASQRMSSLGIRVLGAVVNGSDPEEVLAVASPGRAAVA
jgi:capsular exopolysaccharide synthesis family protein